jgi:hypothetical protein
MTNHTLRPHCIVCGCQLPHLPRAEALQKGAAVEINGLTYYKCIGRHTEQEILQVIAAVPKFAKAGGLK